MAFEARSSAKAGVSESEFVSVEPTNLDGIADPRSSHTFRRDSERILRETPFTPRSESAAPTEAADTVEFHPTADAARRSLLATLQGIFARLWAGPDPSGGPRLAISVAASAGIGKTTAICREIAAGPPAATIWFAVPNHRMAEQLVTTFRRIPDFPKDRLFVLQGRDQPDMCLRSSLLRQAGDLDVQIQDAFCAQGNKLCPYFTECRYQDARRRAKAARGRVIVMTHASLVQHPALPTPDLVIIDEAIWSTVTTKCEFSLESFDRVVREIERGAKMSDQVRQHALRQLAIVKNAITHPHCEMLRVLRQHGVLKRSMLINLADLITSDQTHLEALSPDLSDEEIALILRDRLAPARRHVAAAIRQLAMEADRPRDEAISVTFNANATIQLVGRSRKERQARIQVFGRRQLRIPTATPVLLLDATADPLIDRSLWGGHIEHIQIQARRNVVITQSTTRSGSRLSFVPDGAQSQNRIEEILRFQKQVASLVPGDGSGVAVFGSQAVIEALKPHLSSRVQTGHFNALRGINDYEHCHTALIVGREQPSCESLEDIARSLFFEDHEPLRTATRLKEFRVRLAGCGAEISSEFHPDSRVQAVLAQIREREIEQAMDRLRLINDDANPKAVILIARVKIGAEVSTAMRFRDLCHGGPSFVPAVGSRRVIRLADNEILDDIDPHRLIWMTGSAVRAQVRRTVRSLGLSGDVWEAATMYLPRHRMFEYQLRDHGKCKSGPRRRALMRDDVSNQLEALQALYGSGAEVTNVRPR